MSSLAQVIEGARRAQQEHDQRHDVQLALDEGRHDGAPAADSPAAEAKR